MASKIPTGSRNTEADPIGVSPNHPQYSLHAMAIESNAAISRININGSPFSHPSMNRPNGPTSFSQNFFHNESFSGGVSMFTPCLLRLSNTSASVSPV